jgi:hypothetical protein
MTRCLASNPLEAHHCRFKIQEGTEAQPVFRAWRNYYTRPGHLGPARRGPGGSDLFALRAFALLATVRICATLVLIWLYILVAGAPPSAIRAGVVATFVLAARLFGRQVSPLHFMTTMLAAILAYNPLLVYNTGFQLSVAAVFGILLLRRPLKTLIEGTLFSQALQEAAGADHEPPFGLPLGPDRNRPDSRGGF